MTYKGHKRTVLQFLLPICLLTSTIILFSCKEDSINNNHQIIQNPVAFDPTPMWPMQGNNARHTGNLNGKIVETPAVQSGVINWIDSMNRNDYQDNPELSIDANGNIYRQTSNYRGLHLYKVRPDGSIIWAVDSNEVPTGGCGISLSTDETRIYYSNILSFVCRDSSGNFLWGLPTRVTGFIPAVGNDGSIFISIDKDLAAVSSDGNIKWRLSNVNIPVFNPAIDKGGNIYVFNLLYDNNYQLLKVDPNGSIIWRDSVYFAGISSPVIDCANNIYVRSLTGLISFKNNGAIRWNRNLITSIFPVTSPSINKLNEIITDSAGYMICVDTSGNTLWKTQLPQAIYKQNFVLDFSNNIYCLFGGYNSFSIISYNQFGTMRWQLLQQIPGEVGPGIVISPQGYLFCVPKHSNKLYCIK